MVTMILSGLYHIQSGMQKTLKVASMLQASDGQSHTNAGASQNPL